MLPPCTLAWGHLLQKTYVSTLHFPGLLLPVPDPSAGPVGPHLHLRLPKAHRQAWLSLLRGHPSSFLGSGTHKVLSVPSKSLLPRPVEVLQSNPTDLQSQIPWVSQSLAKSPGWEVLWGGLELSQQCENSFCIIVLQFVGRPPGSPIVGLMVTFFKRMYASRSLSQSPCRRGSPLLTCAFTGDPQKLTGRSGSVFLGGWFLLSLGPCVHKILFVPYKHLWWVFCWLIAQLCTPVRDPMNCSLPGFTVFHYFLEFSQTLLWIRDASQPSHPLVGMKFDFKCDCAPPTILLWLLLCSWM